MKTENKTMLFREEEIEPTENVLKNTLSKELFEIYSDLSNYITVELNMKYEWCYYNDGKSWLFKATHKKKTIFWLAIWEEYIRTTFYFTEKTRLDIFDLQISNEIKDKFNETKNIGKLFPLILDMDKKEQLNDFKEVVKYKKELK